MKTTDDGKDDTEGEEFAKARELRREEVRLPPLPPNLPTDTETEVSLKISHFYLKFSFIIKKISLNFFFKSFAHHHSKLPPNKISLFFFLNILYFLNYIFLIQIMVLGFLIFINTFT